MFKNKISRWSKVLIILSFFVLPLAASAAVSYDPSDPLGRLNGGDGGGGGGGACGLSNFKGLVDCVVETALNPLVGLIMAAALVVFMWGVLKYIKDGDKPEERKKGGAMMIYGIVGFFVMLSVWGLVGILTNSFFGGGAPQQPPIPQIQL